MSLGEHVISEVERQNLAMYYLGRAHMLEMVGVMVECGYPPFEIKRRLLEHENERRAKEKMEPLP